MILKYSKIAVLGVIKSYIHKYEVNRWYMDMQE